MTENALRILVVDDEPAIRRYLRITLQAQGYALFEADSGREALSQVVAHRPDLIILDLGLPDTDGVEVTQILRERLATPIIILSVREGEADKIAALDAGADDYLTKPFSSGELLARIRVVTRRLQQSMEGPIFSSDGLVVESCGRNLPIASMSPVSATTIVKLRNCSSKFFAM